MKRFLTAPLVLLVAAIVGLVAALPSGYSVISPGGSYDVEPRLRIPDEQREEMGHLAFTAVYARDGTWADVIGAWLSDTSVVIPTEEVRPHGVSQAELNEINRRLMEESKSVAAAVALRAAGYPVEITGEGADVQGVVEGMPADGVLRAGDVIVAVDGQPVQTALEVIELTRRHAVGDQVQLTIVRDGRRQDVTVGTKSSSTEPGRPVIGALISTRQFEVRLPFALDIDTDGVGGPSAGLMFALGILDGVTEGLLTRGHAVAGTGTIAVDGTIGPIGGAAQKVVAAERGGAQVFLVPSENYEEAQPHGGTMLVIPVDRFDDAVRALCGLTPTTDRPIPPPCVPDG